jgi:hypothetical protein
MLNCTVPAPTDSSQEGVASRRFLGYLNHLGLLCLFIFLAAWSSQAQVNVLTQHNDNARTGQNNSETILNTTNVTAGNFVKLFALPVTGQVYAQPLYVSNVAGIAGGTHNVVIVATEEENVYAFDADTGGAPLWTASMVDSLHGVTDSESAVNSSSQIGCSDLQPFVGITSTPVIDFASQTIYLEAKSTNNAGVYFHRLHALSLTTGAEKSPGPVLITGQVNGTGEGTSGGKVSFDNLHQMNRVGLLLQNGAIYLAYASHCDITPYHGWIFTYDEATLTQKSVLNTTPNGGLGGFWMTGAGLAADSNFNIYVPSGNGDFAGPTELSDTILKIGTTSEQLTLLDYFTPSDQACLANEDLDLGSGGALLLPDQPTSTPHLLVQAGKQGMIYVVNRDQMTNNNVHYMGTSGCTSVDPEIVEESAAIGGSFSSPSYWNNNIYFWGAGDVLKSIPITNGLPNFTQIATSTPSLSFPGASTAISSNGTTTGTAIVWAIDSAPYSSGNPSILYAYDATNVAKELWDSTQTGGSDNPGVAVKFAFPTIANGKVYVGTSTEVDVYGLKGGSESPTANPTITPGSESPTGPVPVQITDSTNGATIYYTTDGSQPSTSSAVYTKPIKVAKTTTVNAVAQAPGDTLSATATAVYTFGGAATAAPQFSPASGSYTGSVMVTITDSTTGALIYYTTDGSRPAVGQGTTQQYTGPLTFTASATRLEAIAVSGSSTSTVTTGAYRVTP